MGREWRTRTFKAGNSVAVRLPKALGFTEGEEIALAPHADGSMTFWRVSDSAAVLDSLYGSMSPGFMSGGRGDIEQADRAWDSDPERSAA